MTAPYFAIFGAMRTGSNLLESFLGQYDGIACHGELYNPHFFAKHNLTDYAGTSMAEREADPQVVLARLREEAPDDVHGFRIFQDHDPRMLELCATSPDIAKIVLTRAPEDSYVSLKIARATNQWRLGKHAARVTAKITFDAEEYVEFLTSRAAYYDRIERMIQRSGHTAFRLDYRDLKDDKLIAGLARYLGATNPDKPLREKLLQQNPEPLSQKVENWEEMEAALGGGIAAPVIVPETQKSARSNLGNWQVLRKTGVLNMAVAGNDPAPLTEWLEQFSGEAPLSGLSNRGQLNRWLDRRRGYTSFVVLRDPLERAHDVFCRHIATNGEACFKGMRGHMVTQRSMVLPENGLPETDEAHYDAFTIFLGFLDDNLNRRTSQRTDTSFLSQCDVIAGMSSILPPAHLIRADQLSTRLGHILSKPLPDFAFPDTGLSAIRDDKLKAKAKEIWPEDYRAFGF